MDLSDTQIHDLSKPLISIIIKFYENQKNEEDFQRWLQNVEKQKNTN